MDRRDVVLLRTLFAFGRGVCFGITFFLVLNPDGPPPEAHVHTWGDLEFLFFPWRFIVALGIWLIAVTVFSVIATRIIRFLRYRPDASLQAARWAPHDPQS